MTVVELDIPMLPPSPNRSRGQHWAAAKRTRDQAGWAVTAAWTRAGRPGAPSAPATIDVTIHSHGRAGDPDNAWARMKPVLDALVERRLLVDDSPRWMSLGRVSHTKAPPRQGRVVVTITYQEPPPA